MIIISRHAMQMTGLISPIWILKRSFLDIFKEVSPSFIDE